MGWGITVCVPVSSFLSQEAEAAAPTPAQGKAGAPPLKRRPTGPLAANQSKSCGVSGVAIGLPANSVITAMPSPVTATLAQVSATPSLTDRKSVV